MSRPDEVRQTLGELLIAEARLAGAGLGSADPADAAVLAEVGERMLARLESGETT